MKRLTDALLKTYLRESSNAIRTLADGAVPGLSIRLGTGGAANWSLLVRVSGEGGVKHSGKLLLGRKHRVNLGRYPEVSILAARAKATIPGT